MRGHVAGGVVYGYSNRPVHSGTDASGNPIRSHVRREVHPEEADVVRAIFGAYADGHGLRSIARPLNGDPGMAEISARYFRSRRVPSPRKGTGSWDPSEVRVILRRELYRGVVIWGKYRNVDKGGRTRCRRKQPESEWLRIAQPDLRIVPDELWEAVERRHRPHAITGGPASGYISASLLSGLAICATCGGPFANRGQPEARAMLRLLAVPKPWRDRLLERLARVRERR